MKFLTLTAILTASVSVTCIKAPQQQHNHQHKLTSIKTTSKLNHQDRGFTGD